MLPLVSLADRMPHAEALHPAGPADHSSSSEMAAPDTSAPWPSADSKWRRQAARRDAVSTLRFVVLVVFGVCLQ